jgi:hypothetical protein
MAASLQPIRERARAHQADLDLAVSYFTVQKLAARWDIAESTVRDIPREQLPYKEFGRGIKLKRRRYHPDDVLAYEARDRKTEGQ